jgi:hypothetical protein
MITAQGASDTAHADELRSEWFAEAEVVGLTAGPPTLKETVAAAQKRLEEMAAQNEASACAFADPLSRQCGTPDSLWKNCLGGWRAPPRHPPSAVGFSTGC